MPATSQATAAETSRTILEVLALNHGTTYTSNTLRSAVAQALGSRFVSSRFTNVLNGLVEAGACNGTWRNRNKTSAFRISYKPVAPPTGGSGVPVVDPALPQLRRELAEAMDTISKLKSIQPDPVVVKVQTLKGKAVINEMEDVFHPSFQDILDLVDLRECVYLVGPTGTGKTHICEQLSKATQLDFSFISCTSGMSEGQVGGKLLPTGEGGQFLYAISKFVERYEKGGIFLMDEVDAADPNVLLFVNSALSNNFCSVPNRVDNPVAKRHPDFVMVAAANTFGSGADRQYTGRAKLDKAFLDRFSMVFMGYDERIEAAVCPDETLRLHFTKIRKAVEDHNLERNVTTRFLGRAHKLHTQKNWDLAKLENLLFMGWRADEVNKVQQSIR